MLKVNMNKINKITNKIGGLPNTVKNAVSEEGKKLKTVFKENNNPIKKARAVISVLDPGYWAETHPDIIKPVTVAGLSAASSAAPPVGAVAGAAAAMPEEWVVGLMEYGNKLCPPYWIRKTLEKLEKKLYPESNTIDENVLAVPTVENESAHAQGNTDSTNEDNPLSFLPEAN